MNSGDWPVPQPPSPDEDAAGVSAGRHVAVAGGVTGWLDRRGIRIDPGRRAAGAMGLAVVLAAIVAGWWLLSARPHQITVSSSPAPPTGSGAPSSSSTPTGRLVVDVVGKVRRPGVYRLADGARVDDALRAAGGALPRVDLSGLNLARRLADGEQIAVGVPGAAGGAGIASSGPATGSGSTSARIDLNTASLEQLDTLPGVGPVLAQRIVDWRTAHGNFRSVDQLGEVDGIGPSRLADLRPLVTV